VAVTSMTPKDEVTPLYNDIETDTNVRLVYGETQYTKLMHGRSPLILCLSRTHVQVHGVR